MKTLETKQGTIAHALNSGGAYRGIQPTALRSSSKKTNLGNSNTCKIKSSISCSADLDI